jgi:hypothetical protein
MDCNIIEIYFLGITLVADDPFSMSSLGTLIFFLKFSGVLIYWELWMEGVVSWVDENTLVVPIP